MDKIGCDVICKSHSARSDRDQYRICPTKLTKPELEHLYYALLENNMELKKTVNGQQDRIKVLSTKVQRMTSAQRVLRIEEKKDCCVATKSIVNQQKEMISELKRANERMADRIRKLNMRLCSAKQFCKSVTPRGLRCSTATSPYLIKHSPSSYKQHSQSTLKFAVSCQNLSRDVMVPKYVQTESYELTKLKEDESCEDNKCRTLLDELKQKITNLQEELTRIQNESSSRINTLEAELQQTRNDNVRVRSERVAAEHDLANKDKKIANLVTSLRAAEALSTELKMQLSIEKRKVAELETRLKAATMSNRVTQTIEDTLTSIQESNKSTATDVTLTCTCSPRCHATDDNAQIGSELYIKSYGDESKLSKITDDSGYMDANKSQSFLDDQSLNKIIEELTNRILVLQTQVDALTISPNELDTPEPRLKTRHDHSTATEEYSNIPTEIESLQPDTKPNILTPTNTSTPQPKNTPEEKTTPNTATKTAIEETKVTSPKQVKNDIRTSTPIESSPEAAQGTSWKAGVAKLNVVAKITNEKTDKTKENSNKIKNSSHVIHITTETKEQDEQIEDKSISIEEKTYNVPEKEKHATKLNKDVKDKDKNIEKDVKNVIQKGKSTTEVDKNASEKDKNNDRIITNVAEKSNTIAEAENKVPKKSKKGDTIVTGKDTNVNEIDKNVTEKDVKKKDAAVKNDQIVRRDSNKYVKKDEGANQKIIDSPKRSLTENLDIELNEREMVAANKVKAYKSVEQKRPVARIKKLVRAQTEIQTESSCEEATYTVDKSADDSSPDNTDYEISSMTDLPEEKEPKGPTRNRLSPGEHKYTSTQTDSLASPSTNYSLSEGEIPIVSARRKSNADKQRTELGVEATAPKMEETLQAITDELARCKRLLSSQRSHDSAMPSVIRVDNKSPRPSTAQRWTSST